MTQSILIFITLFFTSCGFDLILPKEKKEKPSSRPPTESTESPPSAPEYENLKLARKIRRITLDLSGTLPDTKILEKLLNHPDALHGWSEHLFSHQSTHTMISESIAHIWSLDRSQAFDLQSISQIDTNLLSVFNESFVEKLRQEPVQMIRKILEMNKPFSEILTLDFSIAHEDILNQFGSISHKLTENLPFILFSYDDGRPKNGGILFTNGWLALFPTYGDYYRQKSGYKMRKALLCDTMSSSKAHLFNELTEQELLSNLIELSHTKSNCINCHQRILDTGSIFESVAQGKSWDEWKKNKIIDQETSALIAKKLDNFVFEAESSKRIFRCTIERIASFMLQMPYHSILRQSTALGLDSLFQEQENLRKSIRWLLKSEYYLLAPTKQKTERSTNPVVQSESSTDPTKKNNQSDSAQNKEKAASNTDKKEAPGKQNPQENQPQQSAQNYEVSGLRVLRKNHWQRILTQLSPLAISISFPNQLNPGFMTNSEFDSSHILPTYPYWAAIENVANEFASIVVDYELGKQVNPQGIKSIDRYIFKLLPDDITTAKAEEIAAQIRDLWYRLTAESLEERSQMLLDLTQFWNQSNAQTGKDPKSLESMQIAWRSLLILMLTHPMFFTY